jgi:hypothetical protein
MISAHWVPTVEIQINLNGLVNLIPAINKQIEVLITKVMEETENITSINQTVDQLRSLSDVRNEIETTLFMCFEVTEQGE